MRRSVGGETCPFLFNPFAGRVGVHEACRCVYAAYAKCRRQPKDPTKLATVDGLIVFSSRRERRKGLPTTPGRVSRVGWAMSGDFCWD